LTVDEADHLDDEGLYDLLFRSGFSTATEVTEVSGRGVGMDVVERVLTELDGDVAVESNQGEGTTVRLTLPVTVAMADVWFVESGDEWFGLPASAVRSIEGTSGITVEDGIERFEHGSLGVADGGPPSDSGADASARPGGRSGPGFSAGPIELVRLRDVFETGGDPPDDGVVVRIRSGGRHFAVHCDRVVEKQEVVVKPYGDLLGSVPGLSGATLRGDGRLVNIVDVDGL
jgi:two-component system chemotaxis sensor kinase CheA